MIIILLNIIILLMITILLLIILLVLTILLINVNNHYIVKDKYIVNSHYIVNNHSIVNDRWLTLVNDSSPTVTLSGVRWAAPVPGGASAGGSVGTESWPWRCLERRQRIESQNSHWPTHGGWMWLVV